MAQPYLSLEVQMQAERCSRATSALEQGNMSILALKPESWAVKSKIGSYVVSQANQAWNCTCLDFANRCQQFHLTCKHIEAVRLMIPNSHSNLEMEAQSMSFHTLIIVGNLGRDPEMRFTNSGQPVTNFSVAANRQYTTAEGQLVKETTWFRVSAWGRTGEVANEYLHKGSKVLVEGHLISNPETGGPRIYQSQAGSTSAAFEITATVVRFLSSGGRENDPGTTENVENPVEDQAPF